MSQVRAEPGAGPPLRVLQLGWSDVLGGAARAAYRLHQGLCAQGVDSRLRVVARASDDPTVELLPAPRGLAEVAPAAGRWLRRWLARLPYRFTRPPELEGWDDDRSALLVSPASARGFDLVHLHWVAGVIDWRELLAAPGPPRVWTLHDMNPFTGGCHYDRGCERWRARCGACPQLGSRWPLDASRTVFRRKHAALAGLAQTDLTIVAPSRWLSGCARASPLLGRFRVETIPYGLDHERLRPRDRVASRQALGIPPAAEVVLFLADDLTNPRKGLQPLRHALSALAGRPRALLVTAGRQPPAMPLPIAHQHLGHLGGEESLAAAYSAADMLILPSDQDNLPNTALEASSCATPVVAFAVGGIPDLVLPGRTGLLAPAGDAAALGSALLALLNNPAERRRLGEEARRRVVQEHTLEAQARRYAALYRELLGSSSPASAAR